MFLALFHSIEMLIGSTNFNNLNNNWFQKIGSSKLTFSVTQNKNFFLELVSLKI